MGWEERNGRRYYYKKVWENGTCQSKYMGNGLSADWAEFEARRCSIDKQMEQQHTWQVWGLFDQTERTTHDIFAKIENLVNAHLYATGHHKHRGQWRKKRMTKKAKLKKDAPEAMAIVRLQKGEGTDDDEKKFRQVIKEVPAFLEAFDIATIAINSTIQKLAGDDQALKITCFETIKRIRSELGYEQSSQLERLIIEQIVLCRLRLFWVESLFSQNLSDATTKAVQHWEKRLTANQDRYFKAIITLAKIRKLARRTPEILQVNIGQQQVNQANSR